MAMPRTSTQAYMSVAGEPSGEPKDTLRQVVMNAKNMLQNTQYGSGAVAFQFAQV